MPIQTCSASVSTTQKTIPASGKDIRSLDADLNGDPTQFVQKTERDSQRAPCTSLYQTTPDVGLMTTPQSLHHQALPSHLPSSPSPAIKIQEVTVGQTDTMSHLTGMDGYGAVNSTSLSRTQEKEELQRLNERFASYVQRVRQQSDHSNQIDATALLRSTKTLDDEIYNIRNIYEMELEKLRKEQENIQKDKAALQVQESKYLKSLTDVQDRLTVEIERNRKLIDEISNYQLKMGSMEAEIQEMRISSSRPQEEIERLKRNTENQLREADTWRRRYEHELILNREAESKIKQLKQKLDFDEKVNDQRVAELQSRVESAAATILCLEEKLQYVSLTDVSVPDLLKQVQHSAEAELKRFQNESEEEYKRNLTVLKTRIDSDAATIEHLETEKIHLQGSIAELQARTRNLEGQVANLQHQKQALENILATERSRAAESSQNLERKLREVQDLLFNKMKEVSTAREQNIPLKCEIDTFKALLEEEEKRLKIPLTFTKTLPTPAVSASSFPAASNILPYNSANLASLGNSANLASLGNNVNLASLGNNVNLASLGNNVNLASLGNNVNMASLGNSTPSSAFPATSYVPPYTNTNANTLSNSTSTTTAAAGPSVNIDSGVFIPPVSDSSLPEALQAAPYPTYMFGSMFNKYPDDDVLDPHVFGYGTAQPVINYVYESSPSLNRLEAEPPLHHTNSDRVKSAPAGRKHNLNLVSTSLGQGHDYFDEMFHDLEQDTLTTSVRPKTSPAPSTYNDYRVSTTSATGDIKIYEVCPDGTYISLYNDGVEEVEIGGYMIQQNVGGHPVSVYRFPPRTKFTPYSTITVYAGSSNNKQHSPPTSFVWKEQQKWGTGPECTTILCRPNGQAIAWTTAAHRINWDSFQEMPKERNNDGVKADSDRCENGEDDECASLTETMLNGCNTRPEPVCLRREKQQPPSLVAKKHPHGTSVSSPIHPHAGQPRAQSTSRSNPAPGQPYTGSLAQRTGSASTRKYVSGVSSANPSKNRRFNAKSQDRLGEASEAPSPFMKPQMRLETGIQQLQSQHHTDFLPPMPRPPLFSTW